MSSSLRVSPISFVFILAIGLSAMSPVNAAPRSKPASQTLAQMDCGPIKAAAQAGKPATAESVAAVAAKPRPAGLSCRRGPMR